MKIFCENLKDQGMKIINYEKKKIMPLTDKEKQTYENQKICYKCKQKFCTNENNEKEFKLKQKVRNPCHYTVVFHNGSTYDYHFIFKQLARECKGNFECLGENTEKYITFSVPIKKEHSNSKTATYKLKFIDSCSIYAGFIVKSCW